MNKFPVLSTLTSRIVLFSVYIYIKDPGVGNTPVAPAPVAPAPALDSVLLRIRASSICTVCRHSSAWRLTTVRKYSARWSAGKLRIVSRSASGIVSGGVISASAAALCDDDGRRRGWVWWPWRTISSALAEKARKRRSRVSRLSRTKIMVWANGATKN